MNNTVLITLDSNDLKSLLAEAVANAVRSEFCLFMGKSSELQKPYLTRQEAAKVLGISLPTLNEWSKLGIIPSYKLGTMVRYRYADIQESVLRNLKKSA